MVHSLGRNFMEIIRNDLKLPYVKKAVIMFVATQSCVNS